MKDKKCIAVLIILLLSSPLSHANYASSATRAAEALNAARAAEAIRVANRIKEANRIAYAQKVDAARKSAAIEQSTRIQTATKHTEFLRISNQQAILNKQHQIITSNTKAALDYGIQNRIGVSSMKRTDVFNNAANARVRSFNNNANPGLVYSARIQPDIAYTGQVKNLQRVLPRQTEHIRNPKSQINDQTSWALVGAAPQGNPQLLRYVEQASFNAHLSKDVGLRLTNTLRPMAEAKFNAL